MRCLPYTEQPVHPGGFQQSRKFPASPRKSHRFLGRGLSRDTKEHAFKIITHIKKKKNEEDIFLFKINSRQGQIQNLKYADR